MRYLLLSGIWAFSAVTAASYQEYQVALNLARAPAYSFGVPQYRYYSNQVLAQRDFVAFEYDADAFFADYSWALNQKLRIGANGKVHLIDYQNLNHIVDSSTGEENKAAAVWASFWRAGIFAELRDGNFFLRYQPGAMRYYLTAREKTANLHLASPGVAVVHLLALGYWNLDAPRPYAIRGIAFYWGSELQNLTREYAWELHGTPVSIARREIVLHELHLRVGEELAQGKVHLMAAVRSGVANFAAPGQTPDLVQSFSVGGPEARYRRLAGYAFSEFRAPAFVLLNWDAFWTLAGPLRLWLLADVCGFDRPFNARRWHAGAGTGLVFDLPQGWLGSRSAIFAHIEVPFFAAGGTRFQVFWGLSGQIF